MTDKEKDFQVGDLVKYDKDKLELAYEQWGDWDEWCDDRPCAIVVNVADRFADDLSLDPPLPADLPSMYYSTYGSPNTQWLDLKVVFKDKFIDVYAEPGYIMTKLASVKKKTGQPTNKTSKQ